MIQYHFSTYCEARHIDSSSMMLSSKIAVPNYVLNNGRTIPAIALGTFLGFNENGVVKSKDKLLKKVVVKAIDIGYRHFDTASIYMNENEIGEALQHCIANKKTVKREDLFITTKLWNTHHEKVQVKEALDESIKSLGLDYVDLYLMHWPIGVTDTYKFSDVDFMETWRGMEDVYNRGLAKSIGVCNFNKQQMERIILEGVVKPAVLQIEIHPQMVQEDLVSFSQSEDIVVMGYSPFGSLVPRFGAMMPGPRINDPMFIEIAMKYGKTATQVVLRWMIDRNLLPIPKTVNFDRLYENLNIFDFKLTDEEMEIINELNDNKRYTLPSFWQEHPYYPFEKVENPLANPF